MKDHKTNKRSHLRNVTLAALFLGLTCHLDAAMNPAPYPAYTDGFSLSLNGEWAFKYLPSLTAGADVEFYLPKADVSAWNAIKVPGNWEMQGFAEPRYGLRLEDGLGLYRRSFTVPATWKQGRSTYIRFEGVAFGFDLWVNGRKVGSSQASAFNPHTFDISEAIKPGKVNTLAMQVSTKPKAFKFDLSDEWSLSGIFRDVTLFAVPSTHAQDLTTSTKLLADGSAEVSISLTANNNRGSVNGQLIAPDGKTAGSFALLREGKSNRYDATVKVEKPQLWTAETPTLYTLELVLSTKGKEGQRIKQRIGLREISIDGNRLLLNGRPIKLRGVTHHDLDPYTGKALSEDQVRRDLDLMKQGNVNFIRTSHYPPTKRLIELCDELGFYVMDEVPLASRGGEYLDDPDYKTIILNRVEATVKRDRNNPSVIVWSIGNENKMNNGEIMAIEYLKTIDTTRPVILPKTAGTFGSNYKKYPACVDLYSGHYPSTEQLEAWTTRLSRPAIFTEYAHAQGLATERIASQWAVMQAHPGYAGGSIWHFHDQGVLRVSEKSIDPSTYTVYVWKDKHHYFDTGEKISSKEKGLDGADGLVYADRTPQTDFWEMRKVYAPVQFVDVVAQGAWDNQSVHVVLENRFDFRSLKDISLYWSLQQNGTSIQEGQVALKALSHEKESLTIPVNTSSVAADDVLALALRCVDETGLQLTESVVQLTKPDSPYENWLSALPNLSSPTVTEADQTVTIQVGSNIIQVDRTNGALSIKDEQGRVLVAGIYPHPGRKRLMVEGRGKGSRFGYWPTSLLTTLVAPDITVAKTLSGVSLRVAGEYPRPDDDKQWLKGGYELTIASNGVLQVKYHYMPVSAKGAFAEAGLSIVLPADCSEFRWMGDGPYAGYPGKESLNEFGLHHLNRDDLHFQGNRRRTSLAMLTTAAGPGVALLTTPADVSVERDETRQATLLSHNALLSSLGNKIGGPETSVSVTDSMVIEGQFALLLLSDQWPATLTKRFGQPAAAKTILKPFYHSYDQY